MLQITAEGRKKAKSPEFALYLREKAKDLQGFPAEAADVLRYTEIALSLSGWTREEKPPFDEFKQFIQDNLKEIRAIDVHCSETCRALDTTN
jgi:hypothetical protein